MQNTINSKKQISSILDENELPTHGIANHLAGFGEVIQNTIGWWFDIPWVEGSIYHGSGGSFKIP
jgi:hypothetical protein